MYVYLLKSTWVPPHRQVVTQHMISTFSIVFITKTCHVMKVLSVDGMIFHDRFRWSRNAEKIETGSSCCDWAKVFAMSPGILLIWLTKLVLPMTSNWHDSSCTLNNIPLTFRTKIWVYDLQPKVLIYVCVWYVDICTAGMMSALDSDRDGPAFKSVIVMIPFHSHWDEYLTC